MAWKTDMITVRLYLTFLLYRSFSFAYFLLPVFSLFFSLFSLPLYTFFFTFFFLIRYFSFFKFYKFIFHPFLYWNMKCKILTVNRRACKLGMLRPILREVLRLHQGWTINKVSPLFKVLRERFRGRLSFLGTNFLRNYEQNLREKVQNPHSNKISRAPLPFFLVLLF